jgi:hypothetical protein
LVVEQVQSRERVVGVSKPKWKWAGGRLGGRKEEKKWVRLADQPERDKDPVTGTEKIYFVDLVGQKTPSGLPLGILGG